MVGEEDDGHLQGDDMWDNTHLTFISTFVRQTHTCQLLFFALFGRDFIPFLFFLTIILDTQGRLHLHFSTAITTQQFKEEDGIEL